MKRLQTIALSTLVAGSGLVAACLGARHLASAEPDPAATVHSPYGQDSSTGIQGYRSWTRANPAPFLVPGPRIAPCAAALPSAAASPHSDRYIRVYANPVARHAMLAEAKPRFPVGSVLVK